MSESFLKFLTPVANPSTKKKYKHLIHRAAKRGSNLLKKVVSYWNRPVSEHQNTNPPTKSNRKQQLVSTVVMKTTISIWIVLNSSLQDFFSEFLAHLDVTVTVSKYSQITLHQAETRQFWNRSQWGRDSIYPDISSLHSITSYYIILTSHYTASHSNAL